MKNIIAAVILGTSVIAAVLIFEHAENQRIIDQEKKRECEEARASLDQCRFSTNHPGAYPEVNKRCQEFWQPQIAYSCYGGPLPTGPIKSLMDPL